MVITRQQRTDALKQSIEKMRTLFDEEENELSKRVFLAELKRMEKKLLYRETREYKKTGPKVREPQETHTCNICKIEKKVDDFYNKNRQCNSCLRDRKRSRYIKVGRPIDALTDELKKQMTEELKMMSQSRVAQKYNVSLMTIRNWIKKGLIGGADE